MTPRRGVPTSHCWNCGAFAVYTNTVKDEITDVSQNDLVELAFLGRIAERLPDDPQVLKAIGDLYTRVGLYEKGLTTDRKLARLCPSDSMVWYNLGCSLALLDMRKAAMKALTRAVSLGYRDYEWMSRDRDLRSLHGERGFRSLLKKLASHVAAESHNGGVA